MEATKNGYISKTLNHGPVTITIRRPILDEAERAERTKQITEGLGHSLRDYLRKA